MQGLIVSFQDILNVQIPPLLSVSLTAPTHGEYITGNRNKYVLLYRRNLKRRNRYLKNLNEKRKLVGKPRHSDQHLSFKIGAGYVRGDMWAYDDYFCGFY